MNRLIYLFVYILIALLFYSNLKLFHKAVKCHFIFTASRRNLAQLGHKNLIFACFKSSFVDFFLLKYELTQAQVIKLFH